MCWRVRSIDTQLRYCTLNVFHLYVKDDGIYILHLIFMYYGLWICDVIKKGMEELILYSTINDYVSRMAVGLGSLVSHKTNYKP